MGTEAAELLHSKSLSLLEKEAAELKRRENGK